MDRCIVIVFTHVSANNVKYEHACMHTDTDVHTHTGTHTSVHNINTMLELSCDLGSWHQRKQPLVSPAAAVAASTVAMPLVSSAPESTTFVQCPCCQD